MKYSRHDEEPFILEYFHQHPPAHRVFCDIGAFDGVTHSNTRALWEAGWTGTLCEPVPSAFEALVRNARDGGASGAMLLRTAVAPALMIRDGHIRMWTPTTPRNGADTDPRECSTLLPSQFARWGGMYEWEEVEVPATTLEIVMLPETVFLSVDCEGMDAAVLASRRWDGPNPQLVMAEHNGHTDALERIEMVLRPAGYRKVFDNGMNGAWGLKC